MCKIKCSINLRRILCLGVILVMIAGMLPDNINSVRAENIDNSITVEGENSVYTNFLPGVRTGTAYSGGKILICQTNESFPEEGYIASYTVHVPEAGLYNVDMVGTLPNTKYASPYEVQVNAGEFKKVIEGTEFGSVNSTVRKYHIDPVQLIEGENTITFRVTERRTSPDTFYVLILDCMMFSRIPVEIKSITTQAPMNVFEAGNPLLIYVNLTQKAVSSTSVHIKVTDYWSNCILDRDEQIQVGEEGLMTDLGSLPKGHYTVSAQLPLDGKEITNFFSVTTPLSGRVYYEDTPFALDYGSSWFLTQDQVQDFARVIKLSGASWVRERMRWNDVNNTPGVFDYSEYDPYINALADEGIKVLNVYHESPAWTKSSDKKLPEDLLATYNFAKDSALHYKDKIQGWEIFNEVNVSYSNNYESADHYAAMVKAAAIGYMDSGADVLISNGGFASVTRYYTDLFLQNDVMKYLDVFSFHKHREYNDSKAVLEFPKCVDEYKEVLERFNESDTPLWITEAGISVENEAPEFLTQDEQKSQARYIVTSVLTAFSQGAEKHFAFFVPPFQVGKSYYGMFSREYSPFAVYSAIASLTEALGRGEYSGELRNMPEQATGLLFSDGEDSVFVLWSETNQSFALRNISQSIAERIDFMGNKQTVYPDSMGTYMLTIGPDPIYVRVKGTVSNIDMDEDIRDRTVMKTSEKQLNSAQRVVLDQSYTKEAASNSKQQGYMLSTEETNKVVVEVYNFNAVEMNGYITGNSYGGWELDQESIPVTVGAYEKAEVEFHVNGGTDITQGVKVPLVFTGTFEMEETTASVAYIQSAEQDPVEILEIFPEYNMPEKWSMLISTGGSGNITEGAEGAIQFDYQFQNEGQNWAYPSIYTPMDKDYSDFAGFAFWVYTEEDIPQTTMRTQLYERTGSMYTRYLSHNSVTLQAGWNQVKAPFSSFVETSPDPNGVLDLDSIEKITIGVNTTMADVPPYAIKDLGVYIDESGSGLGPELVHIDPAEGGTVTSNTTEIQAVFKAKAVAIAPESIQVKIDGKVIPHQYDSNTLILTAESPYLSNGGHLLSIYAADRAHAASKQEVKFIAVNDICIESTLTGPGMIEEEDEFTVELGLNNAKNIAAADVSVIYDRDLYEFMEAIPVEARTVTAAVYDSVYSDAYGQTTGKVRIIVATLGDENRINGQAPILSLKFKATGEKGIGMIEAKPLMVADCWGFEFEAVPCSLTVTVRDVHALKTILARAQEVYYVAVEGFAIGQYPQGSKAVLEGAIKEAHSIEVDLGASQQRIKEAVMKLNQSLSRFMSLVITKNTGNVDGVGTITLGDLAIAAGHYGKGIENPAWDRIKAADINGDDRIDIVDLAFIAKRILNH